MAPLLLLILKIIALILLGLLAVVLFVILVFLFVPFVYNVKAEKHEKFSGKASVSWLFGIVRVVFAADGSGTQKTAVKLLGIRVFQKKDAIKTVEKEPAPLYDSTGDSGGKSESAGFSKTAYETASSGETQSVAQPAPEPSSSTAETKKAKKQRKTKSPAKVKEKRKNEADSPKLFDQIRAVENKREIIGAAFLLLKRLLKTIFKMKIRADFRFGTGSPDSTGYLLGLCYAASSFSGIKIKAVGDFEGKGFEGGAGIKGYILIWPLVWAILLFILNKNIFPLIKKYIFKKG